MLSRLFFDNPVANMIDIPGYIIKKQLHRGNKQSVYRALQEKGNQPVIIKVLNKKHPSPREVERFKREYKITRNIQSDEIVKSFKLEQYDGVGLALILEDFGGVSLQRIIRSRPIGVLPFFRLALKLIDALAEVHRNKIIHKDIKPENVIINLRTGQLKITDFGISSVFTQERPRARDLDSLEGTLTYISPEQTGRLNRPVDYRTDYYSLGIMYYKMLIGRPPFESDDPMELIHSHIARKPEPPRTINNEIPEMLSQLIMRLIAKNADDRYRSDIGLKRDLQKCFTEYKERGHIPVFILGENDVSEKFQISQLLYGREKELSLIRKYVKETSESASRMMLISGYTGIGKTTIASEVQKNVLDHGGAYYAYTACKNEHDHSSLRRPYTSILREYARQLLTESPAELNRHKEQLTSQCGDSLNILMEEVSEFKHILGKTTPDKMNPASLPAEAYSDACCCFLKTISSPEHPVIFFLDDLHLASTETIEITKTIILDKSLSNILIVAAYRSNELTKNHFLIETINSMSNAGKLLTNLELKEFEELDIENLLFDSFKMEPTLLAPITRLLLEKTNGNPFFLKQFMENMYRKGYFYFDENLVRWSWDIKGISEENITDNVIDLTTKRIQELPENTREILEMGSCIGNEFNIKLLAEILKKPARDIQQSLNLALDDNLIVSTGVSRRNLEESLEDLNESEMETLYASISYRFLHERVQEAVYAIIPEEQKNEYHLRIGRYLLPGVGIEARDRRFLECVRHLNQGIQLNQDSSEILEIARLNLQAARLTRHNTGYDTSLQHLNFALKIMPENSWTEHHDDMFEMHYERMRSEYLVGNFTEAEDLFFEILPKTESITQKSDLYRQYLTQLEHQGKYVDAFTRGKEALTFLDIETPEEGEELEKALGNEVAKIEKYFAEHTPKEIENLDKLSNEHVKSVQTILTTLITPAYISGKTEFALWLAARALNFSIERGISPETSYTLCWYGFIQIIKNNNIELGYELGALAVHLCESRNQQEIKCRLFFSFAFLISSSHRHLNTGFLYFREAYKSGQETGDLTHASYAVSYEFLYRFLAGAPLKSLTDEFEKYLQFHWSTRHKFAFDQHTLWMQWCRILQGKTSNNHSLNNDNFDELVFFEKYRNFEAMISSYYIIKLCTHYFFEYYEDALKMSQLAQEHKFHISGNFLLGELALYESLTLTQLYENRAPQERPPLLEQIEKNEKELVTLTEGCPENYSHKLHLVRAEKNRILGRHLDAMEQYDEAAQAARENQFMQYEALAAELAAKFYLSIERKRFASIYMREAREMYGNWGANAKVWQLNQNYTELMGIEQEFSVHPPSSENPTMDPTFTHQSGTSGSTRKGGDFLELSLMMKSSQTLAGEIRMNRLMANMMEILMEYTGAERGCLFLSKDNQLLLEAEKTASAGEEATVLQSIPIESLDNVPLMLIHYVARTQENVILNDAGNEPLFAEDAYVKKVHPRSLLCVPIMGQSRLIGIIYLENNLMTSVFNRQRFEVVKLLAAQLAISIKNIDLYAEQEEMMQAFARFVPGQFLEILERESIHQVKLGDAVEREMTILFSDIRKFTRLSENMNVQDNFLFLNSYLKRIGPCIHKNMGFIDKFVGDAIMALFSFWPENALKAAIEMRHALTRFNRHRMDWGLDPIETGIGLHTGKVMLGTIGTQGRMETTVIGDAVNLTSRLESLTKSYGAPLLLTDQVLDKMSNAEGYFLRELDTVRVSGKTKPITFYESYDADPPRIRDIKAEFAPDFMKGMVYYKLRDFKEARSYFDKCAKDLPGDIVSKLYMSRCDTYIESPPPRDWDGIHEIKGKG